MLMGLLDDLLGTKTTSATDAATQSAIGNLTSAAGQSMNYLRGNTGRANDALRAGAAGATSALNSNYGDAKNAVTSYGGQAQGALTNGVNAAVGTIQGSNANYTPYATNGGAASGMLSNALGLNGAAGNAAATGAFQSSPGYQYQVDQASDAAARKAASLGIAGSGNTLDAITRLGSNLANQDYSTWLSNLQNVGSQGLTAAAGISGNNQSAGSAQLTGGTTGAQLLQNTGQNLGNLSSALGNNLANVSTGLGSALSGNYTNLGTGLANTNMGAALQNNTYSINDANAQDTAASANNGILSKLLGTALAPVTGGLSKSLGGLFSPATGGAVSGGASGYL